MPAGNTCRLRMTRPLTGFVGELLLRARFFETMALAAALAQLLERLDVAIGLEQLGALARRSAFDIGEQPTALADA